MFKRIGCLFLSLCLLAAPVFARAEENVKTYVMAGFDGTNTYRTWDTNLFFQRMEQMTGVHFTFSQYQDSETWTQKKALMSAQDADLPDVLFKADLSGNEAASLFKRGVLIDLKPLLEENCPNLWKLLTDNPEYEDQIALPTGEIVSLPYITSAPVQNCMWINVKWLETLKLDKPTDLESLMNVLTAFKTKDPNQNGKQDEVPLAFLGAFDLKFLAHAFGLVANDYNVYAKDGQVHFMPLDANFREFVQWCRDMYTSGLLDRDGFTTSDSLRTVSDAKQAQTYGIVLTTAVTNIMPVDWSSNYEIVMPLSYNGAQVYRSFAGNLFRGTFAITSACDDPAAMLRWVDTLYGEEGSKLATVGVENVDYVVDGDGTWRLTDGTKNNSYFSSETLILSGSTPPGASADEFQTKYGDASIANLSRQLIELNKIAKRPFPYYDLTIDQIDQITPLQNEIGCYVDMQIARWVLGEEEISDESFSTFEKTLKEKGLDAFLAFWQDVLNKL